MDEVILSTEEVRTGDDGTGSDTARQVDPNDNDAVADLLAAKVEEMIEKANSETENTLGMKPLIRLKVNRRIRRTSTRAGAHEGTWPDDSAG